VGAGYFDAVTTAAMGAGSALTALTGSTEEEQFEEEAPQGEVAGSVAAAR
jgi:isocitrate lyase